MAVVSTDLSSYDKNPSMSAWRPTINIKTSCDSFSDARHTTGRMINHNLVNRAWVGSWINDPYPQKHYGFGFRKYVIYERTKGFGGLFQLLRDQSARVRLYVRAYKKRDDRKDGLPLMILRMENIN